MDRKLLILLSLMIVNLSFATTYYVTTSGNNANDGLSEANAWQTIKYAVSKVNAGDSIWVKAGDYGNEEIRLNVSGQSGRPIVIEGYKTVPGDITNTDWWHYGNELDASQMPLLNGGDRSKGTAFNINNSHFITIKNFQITNYLNGIQAGWSQGNSYNNTIENVIAVNFGKLSSNPDYYSGKGIVFAYSRNMLLKNCTVVNAAAEGIDFEYSDSCLVENCDVYCDQGFSGQPDVNAATDYYLNFSGNNNVLRDCYIERVGDLDHGGAGIGMKEKGEYNLIEDCVAKNLKNAAFYVRHSGVKYNTFKNCVAIGGENGDGFIIRDGAAYNNYYDCKTEGTGLSVAFYFSGEDENATYAGYANNFYNCIFEDTKNYFISYGSSYVDKAATDNRFINCVFNGAEYLFTSNRDNENNQMINCIVANVGAYNWRTGKSINMVYSYTDFWNLGFDLPQDGHTTYDNILQADPKWISADNGDYHLDHYSPCIDAGIPDTTGLNLPEKDYYGNPRLFKSNEHKTATIDMGIHEYQQSTAIHETNRSPKTYSLENNFPNPFNPTTTIRFTLPVAEKVELSVYNISGEKVAELINDHLSAGIHSIRFDGADLASGVYLYKLHTKNFTEIKKMILIR